MNDSETKSIEKQQPSMEDMLWKFPHIGENIFKKLSNKNLAKSKKISRSWEYFITNEKFYKQRVHYEMMQKDKDSSGLTPLHKAARAGQLSECKLILDHVEDKSPQDNLGYTPLHDAARHGHFEVFKLIFDRVEEKNPIGNGGVTPLYDAATNGHFEVFKLIFDNVEDKHPKTSFGRTPLQEAERQGHQQIVEYGKSAIIKMDG